MLAALAKIVGDSASSGRALTDGEMTDFSFAVDGVTVSAMRDGSSLRLRCVIAATLPPDEHALRGLLSQYLPYTDRDSEVMYCDFQDRLVLEAILSADSNVKLEASAFFDAAVHWTGVVRSTTEASTGTFQLPTPIYP